MDLQKRASRLPFVEATVFKESCYRSLMLGIVCSVIIRGLARRKELFSEVLLCLTPCHDRDVRVYTVKRRSITIIFVVFLVSFPPSRRNIQENIDYSSTTLKNGFHRVIKAARDLQDLRNRHPSILSCQVSRLSSARPRYLILPPAY